MDRSHIKDHAGSGLDGPPPQNLANRIVQKLAGFVQGATHPSPEQAPDDSSGRVREQGRTEQPQGAAR